MRGREENLAVIREKVSASCLAVAITHPPQSGSVNVHDVLLIAATSIAGGLEDQAHPIGAEICFRILPARRQLANG